MATLMPTMEELDKALNTAAGYADLAAAGAALSLWLVLWERQGQEWLKSKEGVTKALHEVVDLRFNITCSDGMYAEPIESAATGALSVPGINHLRTMAHSCSELLDKPQEMLEAAKRLFEGQDEQAAS